MVRLVHLSEGEFSIDQPIQPKVEKSKLQNIHKRILAEREDELCKLLEKKNKTIECLTKALEDVESDVDRANTLNTTLIELEPKTPNVRESEEKVVDNDTQAATMPKTKLKEIHQEITELKNALNELKKQNQLLQKVRKKRGNQLGEDGENINSENKCDEESGRDVLQRIAFLKNNLICDDLDEERRELLERKLQLTEEYEQNREKVEDAINFMKNYDLDSTLEADRDRIKLIKSSLINKETELDVFKDVVHDAVQKVNDKKQCLEDRQGILNNYKLKCDQVKDLIEQQEKSVAHMNTLYESTMNDIFNEFAAIKSSLSQELQQLLPIIGKLKDAQTQLQNSETLLTISNQKRDSMHQELNYLKSQVENIHEDIHWAKKNEPSDDQNEKLNKQLAQWENDIQVQFNERVALKEKMAELRTNIRKAATKAQEKQKELCQLRLVEVDLRDLLVQQYQHRETALQGCRELGIVAAEYLQAQREQLDGSSRLTLVKPLAESDGCAGDVYRFSGNETHTDHFKLILLDGNSILIGGRNLVHNLSVVDLSERQVLQWYSTEENTKMCALKGKDEDNCQNYIRILSKMENNRLLVCGTNSFKPLCREYEIKTGAYTLEKEKAGQAMCPYDPNHNSTAIFVDNELYTGTVADFSGMDPIIYREPLQTEQYDSMSLNAPNFVSSLTQGDFVYFFFRETAVEFINCGKAVYSRVARVCKYDRGGPHRFRNRWTSFLKSRLNCSVPGDFPFYFDEIQSTSELIEGVYGGSPASLLYGVFTTPANAITGSALCAFSLQTISDTFEGNFKEQSEHNSNWLPVQSAKVPDPRPGQCVNDSRTLPDLTLNFIKTHSLMDESVPTFFGQPILIKTSTNYRFTQIAVDPQIKTPSGKVYDVIFIGTDNGKVLKTVNADSADSAERVISVLIEELQVFPSGVPVKNLKIVRTSHAQEGRLVAVTGGEVVSLALHRCSSSKITTCSECVALQDPYCAWDKHNSVCASVNSPRWSEEKAFAQNVATGSHPDCPASKVLSKHEERSDPKSSSQKKQEHGDILNIDSEDEDDHKNSDGPHVTSADLSLGHYTVETLVLAVVAASFAALLVGFASGYLCGRKCHKEDDDNLPYPDTEYEYFEQRQNVNARMSEPKLLPQEEVTYAEPVLITAPNKLHSPKATLRKAPNSGPEHNNLFAQFPGVGGVGEQGYYAPAPPSRPRDHFGTLRSQREHSNHKSELAGPGYRGTGDGFGTTRSVKKVYL